MAERTYEGGELALFGQAHNWKRYVARTLEPYLRGHVLEVGAGLGNTARVLSRAPQITAFTAIEPDPQLARELTTVMAQLATERSIATRALVGTLGDVSPGDRFDTIVYMDVLEHIEDDRGELIRARDHLSPGGRIVVLSPAHQGLFSEFDHAVGHHRRYDKRSLSALTPSGLVLASVLYLDSVGLLASLANRVLLKAALPTAGQIRLWDGLMVPASRLLDPLTRGALGKSVIAVWART